MTPPKKSNLYGILFMLSTCLIITLSSILIKNLGKQINPFEVVFIRCAFTVLITVTFNYRMGKILYVSEKPALLSIRSVFTACVVLGNFYAISHLPLVEVTALQFSKPLFLIVLAAIFLGETIKFRRTVATIIGFIGIVVVVHPWDNVSSESLSGAHLAVLGAAFSMAVIAIMSKVLTKDHHPTTLVFSYVCCPPYIFG
jgi:drug/metabolite transporter (DMT)-like permease